MRLTKQRENEIRDFNFTYESDEHIDELLDEIDALRGENDELKKYDSRRRLSENDVDSVFEEIDREETLKARIEKLREALEFYKSDLECSQYKAFQVLAQDDQEAEKLLMLYTENEKLRAELKVLRDMPRGRLYDEVRKENKELQAEIKRNAKNHSDWVMECQKLRARIEKLIRAWSILSQSLTDETIVSGKFPMVFQAILKFEKKLYDLEAEK